MDDALQLFHPQVRLWFRERHGTPTDVQRLAWPAIAGGRHVLATAPTGSGKTLAAFLWALDRLARGAWAPGAVRVLYVSPLRALAHDIRRNLTGPLQEIARRFAAAGESLPPIRAALRTGDTPPCQRRRLVTRPPEILITTPESLNLLLSSPGGTRIMTGVATVILDEVHALVGNKRGTHLITAVERLTRLSGEFQRIALSATVRPLETVAEWVGGQVLEEQPGSGPERPGFRRRQVDLVDPAASKAISVSVRMPTGDGACSGADRDAVLADPPTVWERLTQLLVARIRGNRSTLIFGNSRRIVERVARLVNEAAGEQLVFAHHGSLSREVRESVEERLKAGQLAGIVATSSLELGIDVGTVDEVVLVGTPPSISSAIQRVGRSGHGVGEVSRGIFHPYHPRDLLQAAVVSRGLMARDVEPLEPPRAPLDVLAQVILSMVAVERWSLDELFDFVRRSHPYRDLTRRLFDLVVQMLAGRYAGSRVAALASRVAIDQLSGTIEARPGAAQHLWTSGGTIPDRGTFKLRVEGAAGKAALIGELDEEFVWERSEGDSFTLGVQSWRIRRITASDVFVVPARGRPGMTPFWRGEERDQSGWLWERVGALLEEAQRRRDDASLVEELEHVSGLDRASAGALLAFLSRQREASHAPLPHRHHVLMERTTESLTIVHTTWGGRVNRPFAMALVAALRERHGVEAHAFHDDVCVVLEMPEGAPALDLVGLVR
ncbi:MAG: DEAD/DEAH box helicase, partial [Candidatus Riflebacteria bacterium]|nr:DEAD/DEAH box helicase [Candidatus Riflebacteria bacterium]